MTGPRHWGNSGPVADSWGGFVGRQQEVARLQALAEQARAGSPRLVSVEGPAGIGKTALVRRVFRQAGGWWVLWACGSGAGTDLSYGVVVRLLAGLAVDIPRPLSMLGGASGHDADPLEVGAGLLDLLAVLQQTGPVALVVDDADRADRPSLHALAFALRRLRLDRVVAVVIVRDLAKPRLPESLRLALTAGHGCHLRLAGLTAAELRALASEHGLDTVPEWALARPYEHTQGNPRQIRALLDPPRRPSKSTTWSQR